MPDHYHHCPKCYEKVLCKEDCSIEPDLGTHEGLSVGDHTECDKCREKPRPSIRAAIQGLRDELKWWYNTAYGWYASARASGDQLASLPAVENEEAPNFQRRLDNGEVYLQTIIRAAQDVVEDDLQAEIKEYMSMVEVAGHPQHSTGSCHVCAVRHLVFQTERIEELETELEEVEAIARTTACEVSERIDSVLSKKMEVPSLDGIVRLRSELQREGVMKRSAVAALEVLIPRVKGLEAVLEEAREGVEDCRKLMTDTAREYEEESSIRKLYLS